VAVEVRGEAPGKSTGRSLPAGSGSTVQRNTVRSNGGFGLRLGFDAAYRENVITLNDAGTVKGGVNLGANYCNGAGGVPESCP